MLLPTKKTNTYVLDLCSYNFQSCLLIPGDMTVFEELESCIGVIGSHENVRGVHMIEPCKLYSSDMCGHELKYVVPEHIYLGL